MVGITFIALFIEKDIQITEIECGMEFSIVMNDNGFVWTFGSNTEEQIGVELMESEQYVDTPTGTQLLSEQLSQSRLHKYLKQPLQYQIQHMLYHSGKIHLVSICLNISFLSIIHGHHLTNFSLAK